MNQTASSSNLIPINSLNFDSEVLQSKQPVLVAFLAAWSRPCAILAPVLEELAHEYAGTLKIGRVDSDTSLDLSLWYDVESIPMLIHFVDGKVRGKIIGTASREAIIANLLVGKAP